MPQLSRQPLRVVRGGRSILRSRYARIENQPRTAFEHYTCFTAGCGLHPEAVAKLSLLPLSLMSLAVRSFDPQGNPSSWSESFVAHASSIERAWSHRTWWGSEAAQQQLIRNLVTRGIAIPPTPPVAGNDRSQSCALRRSGRVAAHKAIRILCSPSFREARHPTRGETDGACGLRSSFCVSLSVDRCDYFSFRQRICMSRTRRARRFGCGVGFVRRSPADTSETFKRVGKPLASTRICRICRGTETRRDSVAPCGLA